MPTSNEMKCAQCGAPLSAGAPEGLCPACLLKRGLETQTGGGAAASFTPPPAEELGRYFPQLEILELLGRGGMGAVYKARQRELDRIVALKILPPSAERDPAFAERFTREARALAKLHHPNIVTLYEFDQTEGLFYFLMEYVDGVTLRQLLDAGRLAPKEALAIVPQICDALQFAHDRGIVHRDIKPENILLDKNGRVKIADFGVAKIVGAGEPAALGGSGSPEAELTEADRVIGTPQYMAPEQHGTPRDVDHRADIYSLGVVFYQMLTGELPKGKFEPPSRRVQIDVRLDEVVLRAMEKAPELRYQQASEMKTMVETIVTSSGAAGTAPRRPDIKTYFSREATLRRLRKFLFVTLPITAATVLIALLFVQPYVAVTNDAAPEAPRGSHVLVFKLARNFAPGDLIVYKYGNAANLKRVVRSDASTVLVNRNGGANFAVPRADVIGKVISIYWRGTGSDEYHSPNLILRVLFFVILFGVIAVFYPGVGFILALISQPRSRSYPLQSAARFSRTAIIGAIWSAFSLIGIAAAVLLFNRTSEPVREVQVQYGQQQVVHGEVNPGSFWISLLPLIVFLLGLSAPFGTTIFGCVAISQIRHSAGRLYGMGLAVIDALFFPLLALDGIIAWIWYCVVREPGRPEGSEMMLITATALTCLIVDFRIVQWAWRAANRPVGSSAELGGGTAPRPPGLAIAALLFSLAGLGIVFVQHYSHGLPPSVVFIVALAGAVIGIVLALLARLRPPGLEALALGLIAAVSLVRTPPLPAFQALTLVPANQIGLVQNSMTEIEPDGLVRCHQMIQLSNPGGTEMRTAHFISSDFVHVESITDEQGQPVAFTARPSNGNNIDYELTPNQPLPPGAIISVWIDSTQTGLVKATTYPGVFEYHMDHWPNAECPVQYINLYRLPRGAVVIDKSPDDLTVENPAATQVLLHIARQIPPGGDIDVRFRYRLESPAQTPAAAKRQRFEPDASRAEKTSWAVLTGSSELNPAGFDWTVMAHMSLDGVVPVELPGSKDVVCRITMTEGNDDEITLVVHGVHENNNMTMTLNRDQQAELFVNGAGYYVSYDSQYVAPSEPDASPFALVFVRHEHKPMLGSSPPAR
jgi:predicted Ser/Thr protein kinase